MLVPKFDCSGVQVGPNRILVGDRSSVAVGEGAEGDTSLHAETRIKFSNKNPKTRRLFIKTNLMRKDLRIRIVLSQITIGYGQWATAKILAGFSREKGIR